LRAIFGVAVINGKGPLTKSDTRIFNLIQDQNEFAIAGNLENCDRWAGLAEITVPTPVMVATYDGCVTLSNNADATISLCDWFKIPIMLKAWDVPVSSRPLGAT
jgi:hypothetical protein